MRLSSRHAPLIVVALAATVVGCTPGGAQPAPTSAVPTAASESAPSPSPSASESELARLGEPTQMSVLVYNIEYGGDKSTDGVIDTLDADVVGLLESYNRLPEIAANTGYPYFNVGLQLISKYPILEPSGADGRYAFIEIQPGYVVAFFNTHLDYVRYGPALLAKGMSVEEVIASENEVRLSSLKVLTPYLGDVLAADYPVFLTGDLNTPSSLDYTQATVGTREGVNEPMTWPVSEELASLGMRDTYREIYPDPVANPGITHGNPDFARGGFGDRIDYIYAGGPTTTLTSELVGKEGDPDVDIGFPKWTSDHRAVLATFDVTPVALPTSVSLSSSMLTEGEEVTVRYMAPGNEATSVAIVPSGASPDAAIETIEGASSGQAIVSTAGWDPVGYDAVLLGADGAELARTSFWVRSASASPILVSNKPVYAVGEPIEVSWTDGPANRWDWIGVFRAKAPDPESDDYLLWSYVGGHDAGAIPPSVAGSMVLGPDSEGKPWPLPPGTYRIHYLLTDEYTSAAYVDVTVE